MVRMSEEAFQEVYAYCVREYQMHRALRLYEGGYRISDIADFFGLSDATVCRWIMESEE